MALTRIVSRGITDGTITSANLALGVGGKVLQVVSTTKTDTFTGNGFGIDVTGLSVSITPSSASNKILILINITGGGVGGTNTAQYRLVRGSTAIYLGDASGSRERGFTSFLSVDQFSTGSTSGNFLDSPATTSSTTYKVTVTSNNTVFINRTKDDVDDLLRQRAASTITAIEIAG